MDSIRRILNELTGEMIELQRGLTGIPALGPESGGQGEKEKADFLAEWVGRLAPDSLDVINAPDDRVACGYRPNLVAQWKGRKPGPKTWILTHTDVVPPGGMDLWETDPYTLMVKDGRIYGRGVEDNQHALVSSLFAVRAIRQAGLTLPRDVGLVFVADEETGSALGLRYVLEHHRELFDPADLILVPDGGNEEGTGIEISEKSLLQLKFTVTGKQCHASTPDKGNNSLRAVGHMIVELDRLHELFGAADELFKPAVSTFEPTKIEANVPNINTIPGKDVFYLDSRVLPQYDVEQVVAQARAIAEGVAAKFGVTVEITPGVDARCAPPTSESAPVVKVLKQAIRDILGKDAFVYGMGGGTVAAFFRHVGFPAVVWSTSEPTAHQPNESCPIQAMVDDAAIFAQVMLQDAVS
ncbi:MAG: M20 family metallo-hydrolase [Deltaproteobacteria bacterium]|nr:M20 family metallo-hydrolase [Deltaproteobacteria bacterium]